MYSAEAEYAPEEDVVVDDTQVADGETSAANTLSTSGDVTVVAGTDVLFRAGVEVSLGPGFTVELGATFGVEMSSVENWAPAEPNTRYQYTDQELDAETSWYYYGARYYDPVLGRFLQADPVLDGLNRYAYVGGNPVRYTDPTGYQSADAAAAWFEGAEEDFETNHQDNYDTLDEYLLMEHGYDSNTGDWGLSSEERSEELTQREHRLQKQSNPGISESLRNLQSTWNDLQLTMALLRGELLIWPLEEGRLTSVFGSRGDVVTPQRTLIGRHGGLDLAAGSGTRIVAAADGVVSKVDRDRTLGLHVVIDHGGGIETVYAHLESVSVEKSEPIGQGRSIGGLGDSGASSGPHLHFEVKRDGRKLDPMRYLPDLPSGIVPDLRFLSPNPDGGWRNR